MKHEPTPEEPCYGSISSSDAFSPLMPEKQTLSTHYSSLCFLSVENENTQRQKHADSNITQRDRQKNWGEKREPTPSLCDYVTVEKSAGFIKVK